MSNFEDQNINLSAADWFKGIGLSLAASMIAGTSKLAIRKSWLLQAEQEQDADRNRAEEEDNENFNEEYTQDNENLLPVSGNFATRRIWQMHHHKRQCCLNPYSLRYSGMFGMTILNPVLSVFAMNYASPSILAPLGGLTLVWVILFSGMTLGEPPSSSEMIAAILIMVGEVIVAVFGDHTNDDGVTVEDVRQSYESPATISYFAGLAAYMLLLWYLIAFSKRPSLQRFAWGSCGGAITGPQNFLKDSLTVFKAVTSTSGQQIPWFFPLLIVFAILTSFTGLMLLTACMKRYDATYSAAAFVGSFVLSASINAALHYHTFSSLPSTWNDVLYPFGLLVLMVGVFLLETMGSRDTVGSSSNEEEDTEEPEVEIRDRKDSEDSQAPFVYLQVEDDVEGLEL